MRVRETNAEIMVFSRIENRGDGFGINLAFATCSHVMKVRGPGGFRAPDQFPPRDNATLIMIGISANTQNQAARDAQGVFACCARVDPSTVTGMILRSAVFALLGLPVDHRLRHQRRRAVYSRSDGARREISAALGQGSGRSH